MQILLSINLFIQFNGNFAVEEEHGMITYAARNATIFNSLYRITNNNLKCSIGLHQCQFVKDLLFC
jgi:hypothetical protein